MTERTKFEVVLYTAAFFHAVEASLLLEECFADLELHQIMVEHGLDIDDIDFDELHEIIPRHHPAYVKVVKNHIAENSDDFIRVVSIFDPRYDIDYDENDDEIITSADKLQYDARVLTGSK